MLILFRPFKVGDHLEVAAHTGMVRGDVSGKTVTLLVRAWCRSEDHWRVRADLIRRQRTAFGEAGI
jgi:small-conductance mechanosensitive channel